MDTRYLELDAYKAVAKALYATPQINHIKRDLLLSQLRAELKVSEDDNIATIMEISEDPDIQSLAAGRAVAGGLKRKAPSLTDRERMPPPNPRPPRDREREKERREERERERAERDKDAGGKPRPSSGGGGGERSSRKARTAAQSDPLIGRKVKRLWEGVWLECVVTEYDLTRGGHCIVSNYMRGSPQEKWEYVNLHGEYPRDQFIVTDEVIDNIVAKCPADRDRVGVRPVAVPIAAPPTRAPSTSNPYEHFNYKLKTAAKKGVKGTLDLLTEVLSSQRRLRLELEVLESVRYCQSREEEEDALNQQLASLVRRVADARERLRAFDEPPAPSAPEAGPPMPVQVPVAVASSVPVLVKQDEQLEPPKVEEQPAAVLETGPAPEGQGQGYGEGGMGEGPTGQAAPPAEPAEPPAAAAEVVKEPSPEADMLVSS